MAGKFELRKFADIDLDDPFFDSLKRDYPGTAHSTGFTQWFEKKAEAGKTALVFDDEEGLGAFVCLKTEDEEIPLKDMILPKAQRLKISTLRIAERYQGKRLGEGAIGLVLWKWQASGCNELYLTVFEKQEVLIEQLVRYGFELVGHNPNGECVYMRNRGRVDYSDPHKSFPFIKPNFSNSGYLLIEDYYHDTLFPYSELKNTLQESVARNAGNGLSKIYVGKQYTMPPYKVGDPVLIYRIHTGSGTKRYRSCITSYCVVTDIIQAKLNNKYMMGFDELIQRIGNKSVFDPDELRSRYDNDRNVMIIEMLYYGFFGEGNNVNMDWLDKNGLWSKDGIYPAQIKLSQDQFKQILREGNVDVDNVIID